MNVIKAYIYYPRNALFITKDCKITLSIMPNPLFSFEEYCSDANYHPHGFTNESVVKPADTFAAEDMWSSYRLDPANPNREAPPFAVPNEEFMVIDDANLCVISNAMQMIQSQAEALKEAPDKSLMTEIPDRISSKEQFAYFSPSSDLANNYKPRCNFSDEERASFFNKEATESERAGDKLSTEEVMRIAAAHFIELSSPKEGDPSMNQLPLGISSPGLSVEEIKNIELATLLLAAAEKVSNQQYERASALLWQCNMLSSTTGNPVQRVVYYFSEALQERIARETGMLKAHNATGTITAKEVIKAMLETHPLQLICHKTLPWAKVSQFTSMQAIIDHVANAKRIHMIDLSTRHGLEWAILIQELATRTTSRVEYLRISAVGLAEEALVPTGKRLSSFAESLGLPFEFKPVVVPDMKDLRETMFELREGEALGIHSNTSMNAMIVAPESLENVMKVVRELRPCVMVVIDVEAKHNSTCFINRFIEALFYFSAFFDCLDGVMGRSDSNRMTLEGSFLAPAVKSIVAAEGQERVVRHVGISVWRQFFARFGLMEADLNEHSMYQASLLLKQYPNGGDSCTLKKDGKSLLTGWKGSPLQFVSAWKFKRREVKNMSPPL